jgi:hypothetical protein
MLTTTQDVAQQQQRARQEIDNDSYFEMGQQKSWREPNSKGSWHHKADEWYDDLMYAKQYGSNRYHNVKTQPLFQSQTF